VPSPACVRPGNACKPAFGIADGQLPSRDEPAVTVPPDTGKRRQIEDALRASLGRVSGADGAARALGVAPSTLESRIQRLGIDKYAFRRHASARSYSPLGHPAFS